MKIHIDDYRNLLRTKCKAADDQEHFERHLALELSKEAEMLGAEDPEGYHRFEVLAYSNGTEVVIIGHPDEGDEPPPGEDFKHNCDEMGCGLCHVLFRAPLSWFS